MDFEIPQEVESLRKNIQSFIAEEIIPLEKHYDYEKGRMPEDINQQARAKVKSAGFWT
ncbi:acyl-CoA dehydrogenase, partial [Leptospira levettii]